MKYYGELNAAIVVIQNIKLRALVDIRAYVERKGVTLIRNAAVHTLTVCIDRDGLLRIGADEAKYADVEQVVMIADMLNQMP